MQKLLVVWLVAMPWLAQDARADTDTDDLWDTGGAWDTFVSGNDTDTSKDTDVSDDTDSTVDTDADPASDTDPTDTDTDASGDTDADTGFSGGSLAQDLTGETGGAACAQVHSGSGALALVGAMGLVGVLRRRRA